MAPDEFAVSTFEDYATKLKRAHVILAPAERAETIRHDAEQAAFARGLTVVEDPGLLAEVAGLVEWPVVLMGEIGEAFLGLPPEVLRTSMKEHQKFFSVAARDEIDKNVQDFRPPICNFFEKFKAADHAFRDRRQPRDRRRRRDDPRRQPEGAGGAAVGREVLLEERPAGGRGGHGGLARRRWTR